MTKGTRPRHPATRQEPVRRRAAALEPRDDAPALPRSSRFRAHDHEGDAVRGCLGASARHESYGDLGDDPGVLS